MKVYFTKRKTASNAWQPKPELSSGAADFLNAIEENLLRTDEGSQLGGFGEAICG